MRSPDAFMHHLAILVQKKQTHDLAVGHLLLLVQPLDLSSHCLCLIPWGACR